VEPPKTGGVKVWLLDDGLVGPETRGGMHHLIVSLIILALMLIILSRFYDADRSHIIVSWMPVTLALAAWIYEKSIDSQRVPHAIWHLSFDFSYILTLIGIVLILRAFVQKRGMLIVSFATCLAGLPIVALTLLH